MDRAARTSSHRNSKFLSKPERFQPAEPLLRRKEASPWDPWVLFSRIITFWAPAVLLSSLGNLHDKASQQAWREKIALCFIAIALGALVAFLTIGFTSATCPPAKERNDMYIRFGENPGNGRV
jgi:chitin synthase